MMDIVVCTDKWFIMPTGVMMQSVCQNNVDETIVFHVIVGENVSKEDKQDLEDLLKAFQGKSVVFYPSSDIDKEIRMVRDDENRLKNYKLAKLLIQFPEIKKSKEFTAIGLSELMVHFLQRGYIDETYYDYLLTMRK